MPKSDFDPPRFRCGTRYHWEKRIMPQRTTAFRKGSIELDSNREPWRGSFRIECHPEVRSRARKSGRREDMFTVSRGGLR
jgi:hypothetical protein